jgi:hypothetical protein
MAATPCRASAKTPQRWAVANSAQTSKKPTPSRHSPSKSNLSTPRAAPAPLSSGLLCLFIIVVSCHGFPASLCSASVSMAMAKRRRPSPPSPQPHEHPHHALVGRHDKTPRRPDLPHSSQCSCTIPVLCALSRTYLTLYDRNVPGVRHHTARSACSDCPPQEPNRPGSGKHTTDRHGAALATAWESLNSSTTAHVSARVCCFFVFDTPLQSRPKCRSSRLFF